MMPQTEAGNIDGSTIQLREEDKITNNSRTKVVRWNFGMFDLKYDPPESICRRCVQYKNIEISIFRSVPTSNRNHRLYKVIEILCTI